MNLHIETPLLPSRALSLESRRSVWLKLEALQPSGSFKLRGVGHACTHYARQGARRFISSSGGNAGLATAYAGRRLEIPVTVVVPETTPERATELLAREQAEVRVHGASWQEANELALSLLGKNDAFLHPFDDPLLWQGHAGLIDEVAAAGLKPDAIILAVGGGGLLCGVAQGLHRHGWDELPIIAVETEGTASFHGAVEAGRLVKLAKISGVATSLGANQVCAQALQWVGRHPVTTTLVSDRSALSACERFLDDHRLLVEPACGAALAVAYEETALLERYRTVLVVVCGGATATSEQLRQWRRQTAHQPLS
ncbi:pyridoxal-phosphate dependent enzyme [Desulfogranum mediterraneum]|uniref:pyridoxal-phosphate dependent enzyme n=1 Tax=Desulfogranum mediterraneum TaxID=160661 RepID=UPI0003F9D07C|nr:pyridoxal-phosphate dependent enzyme [Desulfogranum mediterraneum]